MKWFAMFAAIVALAATSGRAASSRQRVQIRYSAADQETQRYAYVPFRVPPGTTHITLSYRYDRAGGANAIDLGLYEPGSLDIGTTAFRGWSGGSKDSVTVGVNEASPGYWPGPLPPGEWRAVLGLYRVATAGVVVEVTIDCDDNAAPAAPPANVERTAVTGRGPAWYAGVLHAHTVHSDGELTPGQLLQKAHAEGLDFLAITDHNNTTHQLTVASAPDLLLITGEEVTTPVGHFNVWGLGGVGDYVDFRIVDGDRALAQVMTAARDRGAVIAINHPVSDCLACSWTTAIPDAVGAIEIANGSREARQQAMLLWDSLLRSGRRVTAVDGSDWHRGAAPLAQPAVRVWATQLSASAMLDGLRGGRVVVLADGRLPAPELDVRSGSLSARIGDTLSVARGAAVDVTLGAAANAYRDARVDLLWNGEVVDTALLHDGVVSFTRHPAADGYLRVHVVGAADTPLAVTNPVYLTVR